MSDWNEQIIKEFRNNEGTVGGFFKGNTLLLLHTTGAKSGQKHVTPLVTFEDGNRLVVVASAGGAASHPDWYFNVKANPMVTVEFGTEKFDAYATIASEPERTVLYGRMEGELANFKEYKEKTERVIPVVILSRAV